MTRARHGGARLGWHQRWGRRGNALPVELTAMQFAFIFHYPEAPSPAVNCMCRWVGPCSCAWKRVT